MRSDINSFLGDITKILTDLELPESDLQTLVKLRDQSLDPNSRRKRRSSQSKNDPITAQICVTWVENRWDNSFCSTVDLTINFIHCKCKKLGHFTVLKTNVSVNISSVPNDETISIFDLGKNDSNPQVNINNTTSAHFTGITNPDSMNENTVILNSVTTTVYNAISENVTEMSNINRNKTENLTTVTSNSIGFDKKISTAINSKISSNLTNISERANQIETNTKFLNQIPSETTTIPMELTNSNIVTNSAQNLITVKSNQINNDSFPINSNNIIRNNDMTINVNIYNDTNIIGTTPTNFNQEISTNVTSIGQNETINSTLTNTAIQNLQKTDKDINLSNNNQTGVESLTTSQTAFDLPNFSSNESDKISGTTQISLITTNLDLNTLQNSVKRNITTLLLNGTLDNTNDQRRFNISTLKSNNVNKENVFISGATSVSNNGSSNIDQSSNSDINQNHSTSSNSNQNNITNNNSSNVHGHENFGFDKSNNSAIYQKQPGNINGSIQSFSDRTSNNKNGSSVSDKENSDIDQRNNSAINQNQLVNKNGSLLSNSGESTNNNNGSNLSGVENSGSNQFSKNSSTSQNSSNIFSNSGQESVNGSSQSISSGIANNSIGSDGAGHENSGFDPPRNSTIDQNNSNTISNSGQDNINRSSQSISGGISNNNFGSNAAGHENSGFDPPRNSTINQSNSNKFSNSRQESVNASSQLISGGISSNVTGHTNSSFGQSSGINQNSSNIYSNSGQGSVNSSAPSLPEETSKNNNTGFNNSEVISVNSSTSSGGSTSVLNTNNEKYQTAQFGILTTAEDITILVLLCGIIGMSFVTLILWKRIRNENMERVIYPEETELEPQTSSASVKYASLYAEDMLSGSRESF
ncbi:putative uncharacterized protein DDB_G0286901 [Chrysoperla carnea]|uniref:putative uncharacterized protein DDB_G0286901 n=1 Tax=Chrysoperla carnea TaxID=189513 RepID=UPI001D07C44D|nr:putative uncharacterized protein DDB_G0286901 [Chrysoperla carnea]